MPLSGEVRSTAGDETGFGLLEGGNPEPAAGVLVEPCALVGWAGLWPSRSWTWLFGAGAGVLVGASVAGLGVEELLAVFGPLDPAAAAALLPLAEQKPEIAVPRVATLTSSDRTPVGDWKKPLPLEPFAAHSAGRQPESPGLFQRVMVDSRSMLLQVAGMAPPSWLLFNFKSSSVVILPHEEGSAPVS